MNDRAASEDFVRGAYAGLFRWFCRLTGSADRAADLTQETFAAFWGSHRRARAGVSRRTWLYAVGRNVWRKHLRERKPPGAELADAVVPGNRSPESLTMGREFQKEAERAVLALPDDLREAFTLRFWHEFSYDEIGAVQGVSADLARWRFFAARRRLHQALADWDPQPQPTEEDQHA